MTITSLSNDLLIRIFSTLSTKDVGATACAYKKFNDVINNDDSEALWVELAVRRYGERVAHSTKSLYNNSFRLMMKDDNCLGALPTLKGTWTCPWRFNHVGRFYCCYITCLKLDRPANKLDVYLEARGESDLRSPQTSGVWIRDPVTGAAKQTPGTASETHRQVVRTQNRDGSVSFVLHSPGNEFVSCQEDQDQREEERNRFGAIPAGNGQYRYKGVLRIDAGRFSAGSYRFCYANSNPSFDRDYDETELFTIQTDQSLIDVFTTFTLKSDSTFNDNSNPQSPAPQQSLQANVQRLFGPWPQCVGMKGEECVDYIRSQNPDLNVHIIPHGQRIGVNEVRVCVDPRGIVRETPRRGSL